MAYVKSGATETLSQKSKKILGIATGAVVVILCIVLFYLISPQTFLELVLPDKTYAAVVLAKNEKKAENTLEPISEAASETRALTGNGNFTLALNDITRTSLGGDQVAGRLETYLNSTTFALESRKNAGSSSLNLSWKDSTNNLLDLSYIQSENHKYYKVEQLGLGWMERQSTGGTASASLSGQLQQLFTEGEESHQKAIQSATTAGVKAVSEKADFRLDRNMTLQVGEKSATGDRMNILLDQQDMQLFLDTFFATLAAKDNSAYQKQEATLQKSLNSLLKSSGASKLSLDLYINNRNQITGVALFLKCTENDISASAVLKDDQKTGAAGFLKYGETELLSLTQTKGEAEGTGTLEVISGNVAVEVTYDGVTISDDHYVTGHFVTSAFQIPGLEKSFGNVILELVLQEPEEGQLTVGGSLNSEQWGSLILNLSLVESERIDIIPPTEENVSALNGEKLSESMITYFLDTLPKTDETYNEVYKNIIKSLYQNFLTEALNSSKLAS